MLLAIANTKVKVIYWCPAMWYTSGMYFFTQTILFEHMLGSLLFLCYFHLISGE